MDPKLIAALAAQLGEKTRVEGTTLSATVQHDDAFFAIRVRTSPVAEVFVKTRPLDGFELQIRWGDKRNDPDVGDPVFDHAFGLTTNDRDLLRVWLDEAARAALFTSVHTYEGNVTRSWTYELANDEIVATKGAAEHDPVRFKDAIKAACSIAARSQRWAREIADLAREIGGTAAYEVELGGPPVLHATRSSIDVTMQLVRRAHDSDHLRTLISAPRIGGERLAVWMDGASRPDLPRGLEKHRLELATYVLRASSPAGAKKIDDAAKKLLTIAQPTAVIVDADSVDLWFEGALLQHAPLDAAIALAAHLARDAIAAHGPYR